jgi:hypothetical protein
MGIETKYEYIYYTILGQDWFDTARRILQQELTSERLCNAINRKLEQNKDWTLNKLKVDYSQYCDDIDYWIRAQNRHKECPVFIQIENNQPIITTGSGTMFVFYEEDDEDDEVTIEQAINDRSYWNGPDGIDGLSGAGGRL